VQYLRQFYEMLEGSQWWSAGRLLEWQRAQLRPLLHHARDTVQFYRYRLNRLFRPDGTIDWERWPEIPIVTRRDLSTQSQSMMSRAPLPQHGLVAEVSTSGSTGHPVTVRTTQWLNAMATACNWRGHTWAGLDWSGALLSRGNSLPDKAVGETLGPWGPPWLSKAALGPHLYSNYSNPYASDLEILHRQGVYAYGATVNQLEIFFDNPALPHLDSLQVVMARGGTVSDYLKSEVRRVSQARIVAAYSSKEAGALAHPCPSGHGFHANAEAVLLEIVDAEGLPVAPGEKGRVVVTPFGSTALPLIRYDQGDEAVAGDICECGRKLPHIRQIEGRTNAVFVHPDGRRSREMMPIEGRRFLGAGRWQVRQVGPVDFEVDYVRHDWGTAPDLEAFRALFRTVFFDDAIVTVRAVEDIELGSTGKYREYVNLWQRDA